MSKIVTYRAHGVHVDPQFAMPEGFVIKCQPEYGGMWYADNILLGCGKNYRTPQMAALVLMREHGYSNVKLDEVKLAPVTE